MSHERGAMSYVLSGGPASACAGRRSTTESNHHQANRKKTTQPAKNDFCAHPGHVWMLPRLRTSAYGRPTTIACTALRPRSMPMTDWHSGQLHFAHAQPRRVQLTAWPQLGQFLLPRLYNGGLNHAISAPTPRVGGLYHVRHYWSISATSYEPQTVMGTLSPALLAAQKAAAEVLFMHEPGAGDQQPDANDPQTEGWRQKPEGRPLRVAYLRASGGLNTGPHHEALAHENQREATLHLMHSFHGSLSIARATQERQ